LSVEQRQFHPGGHESLLRAVVEVALDAPSCLVGRLDEARARGRELVAGLGVLDRVSHQLGEGRDAVLSACRDRCGVWPDRRDGTPDATADDDRTTGRG
jgi:hypothetical protein